MFTPFFQSDARPLALKLANDVTNSTVTLADITGLSFTAAANSTYKIEVLGFLESAATTTGVGFGVNGPTGSVPYTMTFVQATATTNASTYTNSLASVAGAVAQVPVATPSFVPFCMEGIIITSTTAGNVTIQFRSEIAASAVTIKAGSILLVTKVA